MDTLTLVLKDLGYTEKVALQEFAFLNASQKLSEFEQEKQYFERKYNLLFTDFEKNFKSSNEENFEQEDDYLAWKFSIAGIKYFQIQNKL